MNIPSMILFTKKRNEIYLNSASSVDFSEHFHVHGVEHIIHNRNNVLWVLLQLRVELAGTCAVE